MEREAWEMKEPDKNENAYNLKMKVNEGTKPNINNVNVKMTMTFELTGNRKSKTKVKDEMDNVDSE